MATFATVVLVLAAGLTISGALFSVVDAVLLKPLPFRDPGSLFIVRVPASTDPTARASFVRRRDYPDLAQESGVAGVAGFVLRSGFFPVNFLEEEGLVEAKVTAGFFDLLGVPPRVGRPLVQDDVSAAELRNVVIGDGLWRRRFGADENVLGRVITLGGRSVIIVGIMPPGFEFPSGTNVWVPETPRPWLADSRPVTVVRADVRRHTFQFRSAKLQAQPLADFLRPREWLSSTVLFVATLLALVLAWVHVAAFQLDRAFGHARELAIQTALGASSWQLMATWLFEALIINGAAGLLAAALLSGTVSGVVALLPAELTLAQNVSADGRTFALGVLLSVCGALLLTLAPMAAVRKTSVADALRGRLSIAPVATFSRFRWFLLTAQVFLIALLLYVGGAAIHSFVRALNVDVGMDTGQTIWLDLPSRDGRIGEISPTRSGSPQSAPDLPLREGRIGEVSPEIDALCEALEKLPFVSSVARGHVPFSGEVVMAPVALGQYGAVVAGTAQEAAVITATRKYFSTLAIPIIEGAAPEAPTSGSGVVLSLQLARSLGLKLPRVGEVVYLGGGPRRVVGIAGDVRVNSLSDEPWPVVYDTESRPRTRSIVVRTRGPASEFAGSILARVRTLTGETRPIRVQLGSDFRARLLAGQRSRSILLSACGVAGLLLGCVAVFGTASAVARERVKETAVRLALGAPRIAIVRNLLVPFILAAAAGLVAGVLAGLGIAAFGSSLLFGIKPFDLPVLAAVAAVVLCCTTTAAIWPLRHVGRVDVFSVLKEE